MHLTASRAACGWRPRLARRQRDRPGSDASAAACWRPTVFQCHGTNGKGPGFDTLAGKSASGAVQGAQVPSLLATEPGEITAATRGYNDAQPS